MTRAVVAERREGLQLAAPDAHLPGRRLPPGQRTERGRGDLLVPSEGGGSVEDAALRGGRVRRISGGGVGHVRGGDRDAEYAQGDSPNAGSGEVAEVMGPPYLLQRELNFEEEIEKRVTSATSPPDNVE
ncbi:MULTISPECIES: hypothetical protein [unclassified Curtobacterium]|uniref:hypothetical protein n=1 Tax=unclassified Curtobacterium TaxID=257496 RepID=UPI001113EC0B|nr:MULTISPECIES: hypothetical protein [unclassified Curtobacterium]